MELSFSLLFAVLSIMFHYSNCSPVIAKDVDYSEDILSLEERNINSTSSFERSCRTKTLCPEGISNIVIGGVLFGFLGCFACAMWQWEVQTDRKARIRIALARNREIDRQLEAARLSQQQQAPPPAPPIEEEEYKTTGSRQEDKTSLGGTDEETGHTPLIKASTHEMRTIDL